MFTTRITTARDFRTDWYQKWKARFSFPDRLHRKLWEDAIVSETLESNGMLTKGKLGIGYGVGSEFLAGYFAECCGNVIATDLLKPEWGETHRNFGNLLNMSGVDLRIVDMNWLGGESGVEPVDDVRADFSWSVCSMDHCGSVWLSKRFLLNQMNCLKRGGIAVHTGEYSIDRDLPRSGPTSWMACQDVLDLLNLATQLGHKMAPMDWFAGDSLEDHFIGEFGDDPQCGGVVSDAHIKAHVGNGRWGTCIVFSAQKQHDDTLWLNADESTARQEIANYAAKVAS